MAEGTPFLARARMSRPVSAMGILASCSESVARNTRDSADLDGRGLLKALLKDAHEQLALEQKVLKVVALGVGHILRGS